MDIKKFTAALCAFALAAGAAGVPAVGNLKLPIVKDTAIVASAGGYREFRVMVSDVDNDYTPPENIYSSNYFKEGLYEYRELDDGTLLWDGFDLWSVDYDSRPENLIIPSEVNGKKVSSCDIGYIGSNVKTITIPESMYIYYLYDDHDEDSDVTNESRLASITKIKGNFVIINNTLVKYTGSSKNVTVPNGIKAISMNAFSDNKNLTGVTLPDGLEYIYDYAFSGCSDLETVNIPSSVKYIGGGAFSDTKWAGGQISKGEFYSKNGRLLYARLSRNGNNVLPDNITSIPNAKTKLYFPSDKSTNSDGETIYTPVAIKNLTMPKGITKYGEMDFGELHVRNIEVPGTAVTIGAFAFGGIKGLETVKLNEGTKTVGQYAFCSRISVDDKTAPLKSVTIPKSVTSIGKRAFGYVLVQSGNGGKDIFKQEGFKVYCYSGTAGEKYAKDNGFDYELLDSKKTSITKAKFKLASTSITYTGKAKMPKLTVTYNGKTLVKGTDYKVTLTNSKKVGKATAKVTGIGKYSGTKTLTYYVVPVKPTISSVKSSTKKKATVKWKKNSTATGYQIQVSLKKNFSTKKSYSVSKNSTVKATISKLTSGKTYYVRMRAYKTIDGIKRYSAYSAVKTVKVK